MLLLSYWHGSLSRLRRLEGDPPVRHTHLELNPLSFLLKFGYIALCGGRCHNVIKTLVLGRGVGLGPRLSDCRDQSFYRTIDQIVRFLLFLPTGNAK